ncbi:anillin [Stigmatopora nigra]
MLAMDPFTEKLLERTRARRENLQKKMAARPNATERQKVKRTREPLTDANGLVTKTVIDEVPQTSLKTSPSKRRCSAENVKPVGETNMQPATAIVHLDPLTDKTPAIIPACIQPILSKGVTDPVQHFFQAEPVDLQIVQLESEKTAANTTHEEQTIRVTHISPAAMKSTENLNSFQPGTSMKSRLQGLADQRKCWDRDFIGEDATLGCLSRSKIDPPASGSDKPSKVPGVRRERLASLAAAIGTWEDDINYKKISKESDPSKPNTCFRSKSANKDATLADSTSSTNTIHSAVPNQPAIITPKSSHQKWDIPATKSKLNPVASPSGPPESPFSQSLSQSFRKSCDDSNYPDMALNLQKTQLCAKVTMSGYAVQQGKNSAHSPGVQVKSFIDRFQERCQEQTNSPSGESYQPSTVRKLVTPCNSLVQNRFIAAQAVKTTTADLTEKHRLERESELAQIRCCHQKNNFWRLKDESLEMKKTTDLKESLADPVDETKVESKSQTVKVVKSPVKSSSSGCGLQVSPSTSKQQKDVAGKNKEEFADITEDEHNFENKKIGLNINHSLSSAVITDLFEGVLEECGDQDHEEEKDALNISSMSLLTSMAETVVNGVKCPEMMMTSTPASSFLEKNDIPDKVSQPSTFQRANIRTPPPENIDVTEENHKLLYSIDAYRSIRLKEPEKPNTKEVRINKDVSHRTEDLQGPSLFSVQQKIKNLTNEMNLQQTIIHQASQALNCCTDEEHGKGSQVEAEAERLLLVASEKREALKTELQRLNRAHQKKDCIVSEPTTILPSKGSICLQEIRLPLKADFVCAPAKKTEHFFFIMIRAGAENIVATPLASTHCGLSGDTLTFPTKFMISDVASGFSIDVEVYCLIQKREIGGDKKKKPCKSKASTPKRFLAITKGSQTPVVASPGGPSAVRTSNFVLVGYQKLTVSSIGEKMFPLEKIPFLCPLEGHIHLRMLCKVSLKVEEKGFLTMFEDVSGFGAWHRRWCILSGNCISYWTYPNDEKIKNPIGCINLASCTTKMVEPANREFCARPNTFELITIRPKREDDKETLVSHCMNTMCVTKNWLSTDTKGERNLWMKKLNQVLMDLRIWQPDVCYKLM